VSKPLDRGTYRLIEWHLHREALMRDIIRQHEQDVLHASGGVDFAQPMARSIGTTGDPVSRKALKLVDGTPEVNRARRWLRVVERTRTWFADATEGKLFALFYGQTAGIDLVAAAMGTDRRRVERLRDNVVYRAAMYALDERLYRMSEPQGERGEAIETAGRAMHHVPQ
jgi:hypothetical protein